ncbi:MAG: hypothetical protein ACOC80_03870 [Petrotogales bacterium]
MKELFYKDKRDFSLNINFGCGLSKNIPESQIIWDSGIPDFKPPINAHKIRGGEYSKTIDKVFEIYHTVKFSGQNTLSVIGGGSLIDLGGFAGFTHDYVKHVYLFPSTTLSQTILPVRSKFSINFEYKKDLLAVTGVPEKIIVDPELSYKKLKNHGVTEFLPIILISHTKDHRMFKYLRNLLQKSKTISLEEWEDLVWSAITNYSETLESSLEIQGQSFSKIIQNAFRLTFSYQTSLIFSSVLEAWLAVIYGYLDEDDYRIFLNALNLVWDRSWPRRLDMSSITEELYKTDSILISTVYKGKVFKENVTVDELLCIFRKHGRGMEFFR